MPLDGGTLPWDWDWGWGITLLVDVVNYLIKTGKLSLREAIRMFMTGVLVIICAQGLSATVNTYEKQQEQEAKVSQSSVGSNAGTIDTPSNNYNKGLDEALRDLGKQLSGMAGAAIFGVLLGLIISEIKRYVTKDTFNAKENHHVVPKKAGNEMNQRVLKWAGINGTTSKRHLTVNIAEIYIYVHYTIHHAPIVKDEYLKMLDRVYRTYYTLTGSNLPCDPISKNVITTKTRTIRDFLEKISDETHKIMRMFNYV